MTTHAVPAHAVPAAPPSCRPRRAVACRGLRRLTALTLAVLAPVAAAQFSGDRLEPTPSPRAADVLPPGVYRSPHYQVSDDVGLRENFYVFDVETEYGPFQVTSRALALERLHETAVLAQAVARFNRANRRIGAELRGVLAVRGEGFGEILTSPLSTAASLAGQLGRNLRDTLVEDRGPPAAAGSTAAAGGSPRAADDPIAAAHRRTVASQLGLDVYSRNPRVQAFLDVVTRAREAGDVGAGGSLVAPPRDTGVQVDGGRLEAQAEALVRRLSASELDSAVADELRGMGMAPSVVRDFIASPVLSPRHRLLIAAHLDFLGAVPGREHVVRVAARAGSEPEALAYVQMARMLAHHHAERSALSRIGVELGLPTAVDRDGRLLLALPIDLLPWDSGSRALLDRLQSLLRGRGGEALVALQGTATGRARALFEQRGVQVAENYLQSPR